MEQLLIKYVKIIRKYYLFVMGLTLIIVIGAGVYNILQPVRYMASTELLVLQKQNDQMDAYTATKAAEKVGVNLSKIIYTTSFMNKVMATDLVDKSIFPTSEDELRSSWKNMVTARVVSGSGIIEINTFAKSPEQALSLAKGVNYILVHDNQEYHGGGDNIAVKTINSPYSAQEPVKTSLWMVIGSAFLAGLAISSISVIIVSEVKNIGLVKLAGNFLTKTAVNKPAKQAGDEKRPYRVLNHKTYPQYDGSLFKNTKPVTMHDHK